MIKSLRKIYGRAEDRTCDLNTSRTTYPSDLACPADLLIAYIEVYTDVRKIWGGFFDSDYKYGCGILSKFKNMAIQILIFKLKNVDLGAKFC